ncbi:hypothetical protein [Phenylobacterium deserti]|nr:hypothetical protein [Phenylobacterium deserti]
MPSGPPELHAEWCDAGPDDGGDFNAQAHLKAAGYTLTRGWEWIPPPGRQPTERDISAINYLIMEWDFGGLVEPATLNDEEPC